MNPMLKFVMAGWLATLTVVCAQPEPVDLQEAERAEADEIRGLELNGSVDRPTLDMYALCTGMSAGAHGYVDRDGDGRADVLRQFGAAMVTHEEFRDVGARILGPLRNQATLRAQSGIVQSMEVVVSVDNGLTESFNTSTDLGAQLETSTYEEVRATSRERIQGAVVSGNRLVSLPDEAGVCMVIRYDAPLRLNDMNTGRTVPLGDGSSAPSEDHPVPPPGAVGDF